MRHLKKIKVYLSIVKGFGLAFSWGNNISSDNTLLFLCFLLEIKWRKK